VIDVGASAPARAVADEILVFDLVGSLLVGAVGRSIFARSSGTELD
jgi:hypothetical protein